MASRGIREHDVHYRLNKEEYDVLMDIHYVFKDVLKPLYKFSTIANCKFKDLAYN